MHKVDVIACTLQEEESYDIPKETEDILGQLLLQYTAVSMVQCTGHLLHDLKDKDTVVRWSAAKGSVAMVAQWHNML